MIANDKQHNLLHQRKVNILNTDGDGWCFGNLRVPHKIIAYKTLLYKKLWSKICILHQLPRTRSVKKIFLYE